MHHELAERAHDQEREHAAHEVHERERGPRVLQAAAGAEEQPRADRAAHRDHLHVPGFQLLRIAGFVRREQRIRVGVTRMARIGAAGRVGRALAGVLHEVSPM